MNILALIDEAADRYRAVHSYDKAGELTEARAAVAELMDRADALERALEEILGYTDVEPPETSRKQVEAVQVALSNYRTAALARCKGESA